MKKFIMSFSSMLALILLLLAGTIYYALLTQWHTPAYVASKSNEVTIYKYETPEESENAEDSDTEESSDAEDQEDQEKQLIEAGSLVRGTKVEKYNKTIKVDDKKYEIITSDSLPNEEFYISADALADSPDEVVLETEVYVRTPVTIYADAEGPAIASFAKKGTCLKVTGHDRIMDNGYIHKYRVAYTNKDGEESEGYVYGKYMVATQEEADKNYNKNGEYDNAKGDNFSYELYGGKAKNLDYYPYEKTEIEGNEFCRHARAMYLNGAAAVHPDSYIKIIKDTDCNAVVMDLKDGYLAYQSNVAKEMSPTSYKSSYATIEDYRKGVEALRETGVYLIGRIVVFNDPQFAKDHPEACIKYGGSTSWPSGYSRTVWEYNVRLAQEAVEEFGFNEIQFDYVRFPESTYEMSKSGNANFRNRYDEEKAQAIQNFCFYAADQLREVGAYISVDVFGESAYSYVTAYGQYWMAIANIVDAISAMPYTDHFGGDKPWENPYASVLKWAKRAAKQQNRLENPAAARTWITGYNTPYWAPEVTYDASKLNAQIKALEDAGLDGGFIPWNALSDVSKYKQYKSIWNEAEDEED